MPSEERIRAEVHRLANGIDVDTPSRLRAVLAKRSPRRRWVPVAAAAVVAMVATGVAVSGAFSGDEPDVDRVVPDPAPLLSQGTPDGTVPSVFGHTR